MRRCKFGRRSDGKCRKTPRSHSFRGLGNAELRAAARAIETGRRPKAAKPAKVKKPSKRKPASGVGTFCVITRTKGGKSNSQCYGSRDAALDAFGSPSSAMIYKRRNR